MERLKVLIPILSLLLSSCGPGGFPEPMASIDSTPVTTYRPPEITTSRIKVPPGKGNGPAVEVALVDGATSVRSMRVLTDGPSKTASLTGTMSLQPREGGSIVHIPLDFKGKVQIPEATGLGEANLRPTNRETLTGLRIEAYAKMMCLVSDCSEYFVNIYVRHNGNKTMYYRHQLHEVPKKPALSEKHLQPKKKDEEMKIAGPDFSGVGEEGHYDETDLDEESVPGFYVGEVPQDLERFDMSSLPDEEPATEAKSAVGEVEANKAELAKAEAAKNDAVNAAAATSEKAKAEPAKTDAAANQTSRPPLAIPDSVREEMERVQAGKEAIAKAEAAKMPTANSPSASAPPAKSQPAPPMKAEPAVSVKTEPAVSVKTEPAVSVKTEPAVPASRPVQTSPFIPVPSPKKMPVPNQGQGPRVNAAPAKPAKTESAKAPVETVSVAPEKSEPLPRTEAAKRTPFQILAQAIGAYDGGKLENANNLVDVTKDQNLYGFKIIYPNRKAHFATQDMQSMIIKMGQYSVKHVDNYTLTVGDLSYRGGGKIGSHLSHQNGLDADVSYYFDRESLQTGFKSVLESSTSLKSWMVDEQWELFKLLVKTGNVDRIFIHPKLKKALCEKAQKNGEIRSSQIDGNALETLRRLRPEPSHANHFHLRLQCSSAHPRCRSMAPPVNVSGCN